VSAFVVPIEFVPSLFVQHPDAALHNCLGHEEARLTLECSHARCGFVSVEQSAAVTERDDADRTAYFDARVGCGISGGEVVG
jgi:hypothetical protein